MSLQKTDRESAAVTFKPRVSLASMEAKIDTIEYLHPECCPTMTIACVKMMNGFVVVGASAPASPENYNEALGKKFAYENAIRKLWQLEGYQLCSQLTEVL